MHDSKIDDNDSLEIDFNDIELFSQKSQTNIQQDMTQINNSIHQNHFDSALKLNPSPQKYLGVERDSNISTISSVQKKSCHFCKENEPVGICDYSSSSRCGIVNFTGCSQSFCSSHGHPSSPLLMSKQSRKSSYTSTFQQ